MVDFDISIVSSIKWYPSLQNIMVSKNQQLKLMNNACKLKNDNGHVCEKCNVVLPILGVGRLVLDCNTFLDGPAMRWNRF